MEEIERRRREFRRIVLDFDDDRDARRQLEANMRHWERHLAQLDADIEQEPERIRRFYDVQRTRVEPARRGWCTCGRRRVDGGVKAVL